MISPSKPIRQLSEHSIRLISSCLVAANLSAALRELIANSIDAHSTRIRIVFNYLIWFDLIMEIIPLAFLFVRN